MCPPQDSSETGCVAERLYSTPIVYPVDQPFDYVFERVDGRTGQTIDTFGAGHDIDEHNSTIQAVYTYSG